MEFRDLAPVRVSWVGSEATRPAAPYPEHEELGEYLVTQRCDLGSIIGAAGFDPNEIANIFRGQHAQRPVYNGLIHSSLDLDRMDYLIRDAIGTVVPFGRLNIEDLLTHLTADRHGRYGLES